MACLKRRGKAYYAQYYVGTQQKRINLHTSLLSVAKERLRQIESSLYREEDIPLPTRTPTVIAVENYIEYMRSRKTAGSVVRDIYYLRQAFGQITPSLKIKNEKISTKGVKRSSSQTTKPIAVQYFEQVSTADISELISARVRRQALAPKTAIRQFPREVPPPCRFRRGSRP